jgi:LysM repeat protein
MIMAMELIKENIECEQLLGENTADTIVKAEYVIPDTQPDVSEILMLDAKPLIIGKEVMQDKVYIEGQMVYNIMYLGKVEDRLEVFSAVYTGKYSNYVEVLGCQHKMNCEAECYVEHINCGIVNERKISIEGIIKLKSEVYKNYDFEIVKDVEGVSDIQMLKNPATVDKLVGSVSGDMVAKCRVQVPMEKPQIGSILKCGVTVHKKDVKLMEGKIKIEANAMVGLLYKSKEGMEIVYMTEDVPISREIDMEKAAPDMESFTDFIVSAVDPELKEDDLGESRILDVEALVKTNTKVMVKEEIDVLDDAYCPSMLVKVDKKDYELNVMHGHSKTQTIVKGDIELPKEIPQADEVIMCFGDVCITDKKLVEDKVIVEGVLKSDVLYKTKDSNKAFYKIGDELPFTCALEVPGCKIDMHSMAKVCMESMDGVLEGGSIAIKAVVEVYVRVNYITHKEFMVDVVPDENEMPKKKASVTIYVVQQGDTLWKIAKKYNTTLDVLVRTNEIENPDTLKPGQKLIIPGRAVV